MQDATEELYMLQKSPETIEWLRRLRVVRNYRSDPIDPTDLDAILQVARWTGSAKNRQNWRFILVRSTEQKQALAACGDSTSPLLAAPLVIAPVGLPDAYEWDMGRVSQNIMLAAAAVGIGSCPITMHRPEQAARVLGLPTGHSCRIVISLGYPDEARELAMRTSRTMTGRKSLEGLIALERF